MCSSPGWSIFLLLKAHLPPTPIIWLHALLPQSFSLLKISKLPLLLVFSLLFVSQHLLHLYNQSKNTRNTHKKTPSHHQVHVHQSLLFSFLSNFYKPSIYLLSLFISHSLLNSLFSGSAILVTYKLANFMNIFQSSSYWVSLWYMVVLTM